MGDGNPDSNTKAQAVRDYLAAHPRAKDRAVAEALSNEISQFSADYVGVVRRRKKKSKRRERRQPKARRSGARSAWSAKFPRHSLEKALRIPSAILEQNAGRECSPKEAAVFLGLGSPHGPFMVEVSSAIKFGLLTRPGTARIAITELAKKILRPQDSDEELSGLRQAAVKAPDIAEVYSHYRGENLPDDKFFDNALVDNFEIPQDKLSEFKAVFFETLTKANLLQEHDGKYRVIDAALDIEPPGEKTQRLKKLEKSVTLEAGDTCFVMMPFQSPHGDYYTQIYEPAIKKAGLRPVRADHTIFGTGKIMNQVWSGIKGAKVLLAELTTKNPNVFYELGLAHALTKPVVLVSANEDDVPFDLHYIRVIYYNQTDPFWGNKLMEKVAENVLSAIKNPEEAIFEGGTAET